LILSIAVCSACEPNVTMSFILIPLLLRKLPFCGLLSEKRNPLQVATSPNQGNLDQTPHYGKFSGEVAVRIPSFRDWMKELSSRSRELLTLPIGHAIKPTLVPF
jgi:hypothetical protein